MEQCRIVTPEQRLELTNSSAQVVNATKFNSCGVWARKWYWGGTGGSPPGSNETPNKQGGGVCVNASA